MKYSPALLAVLLLCACPKQTTPETSVTPPPEAATPGPAAEPEPSPPATMAVHPAAEVVFGPLRPDEPEGAQFAVIAGDPAVGPVRFLLKLPAGHVTPLHLHRSASRGVVLVGTAQRGGHERAMVDLPPGSSWEQPAHEAHADGCSDAGDCLAWVEMDGPLHVGPATAPLDGGGGGIVTLAEAQPWAPVNPADPDLAQLVVLKGDASAGPVLALMRWPVGYESGLHTHPGAYDAAVVAGLQLHGPAVDGLVELAPGSWWSQPANQPHLDVCGQTPAACTLIISMDGPLEMRSVGE